MSDDQRGYDDARRGNQQLGQGADYDRGQSQARREMAIEMNRRAWGVSDFPPPAQRQQSQATGSGSAPDLSWLAGLVLIVGLLCGFVLLYDMIRPWMLGSAVRSMALVVFFVCTAGLILSGLGGGEARRRAWGLLLLLTMATMIGLNLFFSTGHRTYPAVVYRAASGGVPAAGIGILAAMIAVAILIGALTVRGALGWGKALLASAAMFATLTVAQLTVMW
jgi:hypothetical protein